MLKKYINSIRKHKNGEIYTFYGDGQGDYEIWDNEIPDDRLLKEYIEDMQRQIELAKEILELKQDF